MSAYFKVITERNKLSLNKPQDLDIVYYSELNEWETANAFRSFSVKCVLDETIHYRISKKEHVVRKGQYLVSLKQPDVKAYFECGRKVKSICIDICPATISEVFTLLTRKSDPPLDDYLTNHFKYPEFYESVLNMHDSPAGQYLQGLGRQIQAERRETEVTKDWIYGLTERIIVQEYG